MTTTNKRPCTPDLIVARGCCMFLLLLHVVVAVACCCGHIETMRSYYRKKNDT